MHLQTSLTRQILFPFGILKRMNGHDTHIFTERPELSYFFGVIIFALFLC